MSVWEKVQLARHAKRPLFLDYANQLFTEFDVLQGDRAYADDKAILGGMAMFNDQPVMLIGQHRGRSTRERIEYNFGMANPEGYRKVVRLVQMAERFKLPVLTFIDTQGAYPGVGAEERGQAQAIAQSIAVFSSLNVPVIATVIGEGGSGGIAGGLFASYQRFVSPESFTLMESIMILCMVVLGGMGNIRGVIVGAILITFIPEVLRSFAEPVQMQLFGKVILPTENVRMLFFGLALILMMLLRPQGILPAKRRASGLKKLLKDVQPSKTTGEA